MTHGATSRCTYVKATGERCKANAMSGSQFCFFHSPEKVSERAAARKAGGRANKAAVLPPETPDVRLKGAGDVVRVISETMNQVRRGEIDPRVANSIGYLAGVLLKALEADELEERLSALESVVTNRPVHHGRIFDADATFDLEGEGSTV